MPPRSRAVVEGRADMGEPVSAIEALVKAVLSQQAETLRNELDGFLANLRAA